MKRKFWILVAGSVIVPLIFLGVGSLYFIKNQNRVHLQSQAKINLKKNHALYEQILDKQIGIEVSKKSVFKTLHSFFPAESIVAFSKSGDTFLSSQPSLEYLHLKQSLRINASVRTQWFVKMNSKNKQDAVLFFVKQWKDSDIFLITNEAIKNPLLIASESSLIWIGVCFIFSLFILGLLALVIQPLFFSYESLKSAFIYFGKTGTAPSWLDAANNPFLYFYKNWSFLISKRRSRDIENTSHKPNSKTFRDVMENELSRIKLKFPKILVSWNIQSDIKIWGFSYFMKIICRELILNAVESMGGSKNQEITISCEEKQGQFVFSIRDKGHSLSDKDLKKAFTLYYSTKSQLGVGLNIVQSIVSSNQGSLEIFPLVNEGGTEVKVSFPFECFLQSRFEEKPDSLNQNFKEDFDPQNIHYKEEFYKKSLQNRNAHLS